MTKDELHDFMRAKLEALGKTSDDVAAALTVLGIKGVPISANKCPVRNYMMRALEDANAQKTTCSVSPFQVRASNGITAVTDLPEPVRAFVNLFDSGEYPFLKE